MNDTYLIDRCQARLLVQNASNIESFARSDTGVVIDSMPHPSRTWKKSLFAPLVVHVYAGYSAFAFYTPTRPFIR